MIRLGLRGDIGPLRIRPYHLCHPTAPPCSPSKEGETHKRDRAPAPSLSSLHTYPPPPFPLPSPPSPPATTPHPPYSPRAAGGGSRTPHPVVAPQNHSGSKEGEYSPISSPSPPVPFRRRLLLHHCRFLPRSKKWWWILRRRPGRGTRETSAYRDCASLGLGGGGGRCRWPLLRTTEGWWRRRRWGGRSFILHPIGIAHSSVEN